MEEQNEEAIRVNLRLMWKTWDIRSFMIVSLLIQTLLTFFAPLRKRTSSSILGFSLWLLYLSADAVALFTIGLISSNSGPDDSNEVDLLAFWASFLLLHLGGPDTITALALADNELWHRHALSLMTQVAITFYVFWRSLGRNFKNRLLWIPTLLMFIDGCTKYLERTCALYFASMDSFRDSLRPKPEAGPNYARLVEEFSSARDAHIPIKIHGKDSLSERTSDRRVGKSRDRVDGSPSDPQDEALVDDSSVVGDEGYADEDFNGTDEKIKKVKIAYYFYNKFKGLLVDAYLSFKDREQSRLFFLEKPPLEFEDIISTELHIMYDVFYTKVFLIQKKLHYVRFLCFSSVIASLLLFSLEDKRNYKDVDVMITFALLGGAIALDICAAVMFILSDWWIIITFVTVRSQNRSKILKSLMKRLFEWSKWARTLRCCQWVQSISSYNLLERCFKDPPSFLKYSSIKRVRDVFIGHLYVRSNPISSELIKFIMKELQMKAKKATDTESTNQLCTARGNLVLQEDYFLISECLSPWTIDLDYDESLLIWHLATDICYRTSVKEHRNPNYRTSDKEPTTGYRKFSKILSDYMSYLLLRQESLMSPVAGISEIRFEDTCAEAKKFFKTDNKLYSGSKSFCPRKDMLEEFCKEVLKVKSIVKPMVAKGDKSKSVLFDACRLAKQLEMFKEKQWEITAKVWVELLGYAASRCSPRSHLAQLNQGGELITLVWLSMAQLGLGEHFRQNQGFGWTKLVMED